MGNWREVADVVQEAAEGSRQASISGSRFVVHSTDGGEPLLEEFDRRGCPVERSAAREGWRGMSCEERRCPTIDAPFNLLRRYGLPPT